LRKPQSHGSQGGPETVLISAAQDGIFYLLVTKRISHAKAIVIGSGERWENPLEGRSVYYGSVSRDVLIFTIRGILILGFEKP
jgi:hypothetical protein